jgi:hypothetical protein
MASETPQPPPPPSTQASAPPPPPAPTASHDEWRAWRRQQRDYERAMWRSHGWSGPSWYGPGWYWFGRGWFWGVVIVIVGLYSLLSNLGLLSWLRGDILWPILIILFGVALLVGRRGWWRW